MSYFQLLRRGKISMTVKVIVDECGMVRWKPETLRKCLLLSWFWPKTWSMTCLGCGERRWTGGGEDTGSSVSPELTSQPSSSWTKPSVSSSRWLIPPFPFSPLEELSRPWWRPAGAAQGSSDGRGCLWLLGFILLCFLFVCLFICWSSLESKEKWKECFSHIPSFWDGWPLTYFNCMGRC